MLQSETTITPESVNLAGTSKRIRAGLHQPMRILVLSEDPFYSSSIEAYLRNAGFDVTCYHRIEQGIEIASSAVPTLAIVDGTPKETALPLLQMLRRTPGMSKILISVLTDNVFDDFVATAFEAGADDVSSKTQSSRELVSRLRAMLRRSESGLAGPTSPVEEVASCRKLVVDRRAHRVVADDNEIELTPIEFSLLDTFVRNPGAVLTREQLLGASHGSDCVVTKRTVDVHVRSLRIKLGDLSSAIETVRGLGYRLNEELLDGSNGDATFSPSKPTLPHSSYTQGRRQG